MKFMVLVSTINLYEPVNQKQYSEGMKKGKWNEKSNLNHEHRRSTDVAANSAGVLSYLHVEGVNTLGDVVDTWHLETESKLPLKRA